MTAIVLAAVVGFASRGLSVAALVLDLVRRRRAECPDPDAHDLSSADQEAISDEFATHAAAVRHGLSRYADELADGDRPLRERLRTFERQV